MPSLAVITDSGAGLPKEWYEKRGILVAQHFLNWSDGSSKQEFNFPPEVFFTMLEAGTIPNTSSPNPADFAALFNLAFDKDCNQVLVVTGVKELNRVYDSAIQAAAAHPRRQDILVVDTHTAGPAQGLVAAHALQYFNSGNALNAEKVEEFGRNTRMYVAADDLKFLASGGRVSGLQLLVGSMLQIKPIVSIVKREGEYGAVPIEKPRSMAKAISTIADYVKTDASAFAAKGFGTVDIAVVHCNSAKVASGLEERVVTAIRGAGLRANLEYSGQMTPVIGKQFGPGAVGVAMLYRTG